MNIQNTYASMSTTTEIITFKILLQQVQIICWCHLSFSTLTYNKYIFCGNFLFSSLYWMNLFL